MARSLVLGNGSMLVGFDFYGQAKDVYYDYVGLENQMSEESVNMVGVWIDGKLRWLNDSSWQISVDYKRDTLASLIVCKNNELELELHFEDIVYNEKPIFLRSLKVINLANRKRDIKVYFNHQFRMYGTKKGDTVYFDPQDHTIVHYKGRRVALIGGQIGKKSFTDYSVGLSNIEGKAGTWADAEDGLLSKNPVEHGTVDSTISFEKTCDAGDTFSCSCWVIFGKKLEDVKDSNEYLLKKGVSHVQETTQDYWEAWLSKSENEYEGLDQEVLKLYKKSLLILRTHLDNSGAIIASSDSQMLQFGRDNYSYVWQRDGAYVAMALDRAGYSEASRKFFEFCKEVISEEGFFFHKYRPDKSLGSSWHPWIIDGKLQLPIQEDETAIVIYALWQHYEVSQNLEFIEDLYNPLIKKAADFMVGFRNETHLPNPSYDLWEMKWGIHTYTVATVYAALIAAAKFAKLLGKEEDMQTYSKAATEIKEAGVKLLINQKENYFYKFIDIKDGEIFHDETIDTSSLFGSLCFELFEVDSQAIDTAWIAINTLLNSKGEYPGQIRFAEDNYYRENTSSPGNPWIITTLWKAQMIIKRATKKDDLLEIPEILNKITKRAQTSGILSEQWNPDTGAQLSAAPLTWSHAEFVTTVLEYDKKIKQLSSN